MSKYENRETVRNYFDNNDSFKGGYRGFADLISVPRSSLVRELNILVTKKVITKSIKDNVTIFEKVGTVKSGDVVVNIDNFNKKIGTDKIKFAPRQHRLINYLKDDSTGDYILKAKVLYYLREFYFNFEDVCDYDLNSFVRDFKNDQHNKSAYGKLTRDVRFINEHIDIRQVIIVSKGGKGGGIKIPTRKEVSESLIREEREVKNKLWHISLKKKFLNNNGQSRLVFGNEKPKMEVLANG